MLDPKTQRFLKVLQSADGKWVPKSSLLNCGINVASLNIGHLLELAYIEEIVHLEEQLPARQMVVAYNENIPLSQAARQFIDML